MAESLADFLLESYGAHRADRACRQRRGYRMESFTYGEILDMAYGFARKLEARGIAKGGVAKLGPKLAEWMPFSSDASFAA
jgi:hypothetical protein